MLGQWQERVEQISHKTGDNYDGYAHPTMLFCIYFFAS